MRSSLLLLAIMLLPTSTIAQPTSRPTKSTEKAYGAYLFVFHKDDDHSLHMALSRDGYTFTDVNGGNAVLDGKTLAEQKGVRDPYIARGPDGAFYIGLTDLHVFGQRDGVRDTEWERPGNKYGWGNNRALVLLKSRDLIHWTHTDFRIDKAFPELGDVGCAWAPHIIYDEEEKKMMVSFTMRIGNGRTGLYYSYANDDFTKLVTTPKVLFQYPRPVNILDDDITKVGDKYHMFYVAQEKDGGIRHAVSSKINRDYVFEPEKIDPEKVGCEAPSLWRRTGTDTYVLMVDVFGVQPHNFGFMETTDFATFKPIGRFNEGVMKTTNFTSPKHGAVIPVTQAEADALAAHWKCQY
jgi:hypothetical protein